LRKGAAMIKRYHLNGRGFWNEDETGLWVHYLDHERIVHHMQMTIDFLRAQVSKDRYEAIPRMDVMGGTF
jgi:hypothetical protein